VVLVTGASGFLGQYLTRYLSEQGESVRALYHRHTPSTELEQLPGVKWLQCDMLDVYALEDAMQGVTHIYHCAAMVSFNPQRREQMMHLNIESATNLVNLAIEQNITKLVHVSSIAALGRNAKHKNEITEDDEWEDSKQNSAYAISKYYSEMEVWRGIAEGLNAVIVNPGIILGAGNWNEGSANIMRVVDKEFPFYTLGVNAWVDVSDVVIAMYQLMKSEVSAARFILSSGNYSYRDIFTKMAIAINKRPPHIKVGPYLTGLLAQFYMLRNKLLGGAATITRETSRNAHLYCYYNNEKLFKYLPAFEYMPLEVSINRMAVVFKTAVGKK